MKKWTERIGDLLLYRDNQVLAFHKPAGMPVQPDPSGDKALLDLAEIYAQHPLHLVHRIDRPASGVVLLARNKRAMATLSQQFQERRVVKRYYAVVAGQPEPPTGELVHYLRPGRGRVRASTKPGEGAREARLNYRWVAASERYHLLDIDMRSGRRHQVRAQLAAIGLPIKGDVRYGFRRGNRDRSIHLHARSIACWHPVSGEALTISAPIPNETVWQAFALPETGAWT